MPVTTFAAANAIPHGEPGQARGSFPEALGNKRVSPSLYEASIPLYNRGLNGLRLILGRARVHAGGDSESSLLTSGVDDRLNTLAGQVVLACHRAATDIRRVLGFEVGKRPKPPASFDDMDRLIGQTTALLDSVDADALNGVQGSKIAVGSAQKGTRRMIGATEFILLHSIPQFYFHLTTAYVILRYNGVPLRKPDFLGSSGPTP